jgi:hypothetical protein
MACCVNKLTQRSSRLGQQDLGRATLHYTAIADHHDLVEGTQLMQTVHDEEHRAGLSAQCLLCKLQRVRPRENKAEWSTHMCRLLSEQCENTATRARTRHTRDPDVQEHTHPDAHARTLSLSLSMAAVASSQRMMDAGESSARARHSSCC